MADTLNLDAPTQFLIPFRVYTLPNGRQSDENFACDCKATHDMAKDVISAGYRFEAERLRDGTVSLTCHDIDEEIDIAIELCANGPAVSDAVRKLVIDSHRLVCP